MPECGAFGVPLYTRWLPKRPLMRPCTGQMKACAKPVRSSSRVRTATTRACSRSMRSAMALGGFTVAGGTPLICSIGQSRGVTAIASACAGAFGGVTSTCSGPVSSRPTPNTTLP